MWVRGADAAPILWHDAPRTADLVPAPGSARRGGSHLRRLGIAFLVLLLLGLGLFALRGRIAPAIMRAAASRIVAADPIAALPDGLHLTLCGAGSPLPDPARSGPCVGVVAGQTLFVVDAGSAASRNMTQMGLPPADTAAVFLTHFHSDHIDGLGELALQRWAGGNHAQPLPLFGPPGVESVAAGFNQAYRLDAGYRVAHHGPAIVPPSGAGLAARRFAMPVPGAPVVVWDEAGVTVTAFAVDHEPVDPAVGYRFDYGDRSLVVSGDTKKSDEVARISKGVDLLVHEALAAHLVAILTEAFEEADRTSTAKITRDILDYHATPVEAAQTAAEAGARHLLFYHVVPPLIVPGVEVAFLDGVSDAFAGGVTLGRDGTRISLPKGSEAIEVSGD
jgi:ribonuclease Z